MSNSISSFIGGFGGGFRPNRFTVSGDIGSASSKTMTFHVRSTNLPASSISTIMVPYRGRIFKMPGNRTYSSWQMTILDDEDTNGEALWKPFHDWSNEINNHTSNITDSNDLDFSSLMKTWTVNQLDINGNITKTISMHNCWPAEVGAITLNMDDNETLSTFPVTLEYSHFTVVERNNSNNRNSPRRF